jgi:hypothetical protein
MSDDYDQYEMDDDEPGCWYEDPWQDCGLDDKGYCSMSGSEHCDFSCPYRDSELFRGSSAWLKKHKKG